VLSDVKRKNGSVSSVGERRRRSGLGDGRKKRSGPSDGG
jgi:hypothetical protein